MSNRPVKRQWQVWELYEQGFRYEIIAKELGISVVSTRTHVCNAKRDLGLTSPRVIPAPEKRKIAYAGRGL